ncbi:HET-domain-containing protein [Polyplosphaeria fusca]|uniref:HET-domain-containing protein n=1 Tax=Polyplosphaeria fusca TaxID=682080 RepID=A0A9P4R662_9PLEO|nr:HET-domain-containing protein [Polyplosphaeria fusca]
MGDIIHGMKKFRLRLGGSESKLRDRSKPSPLKRPTPLDETNQNPFEYILCTRCLELRKNSKSRGVTTAKHAFREGKYLEDVCQACHKIPGRASIPPKIVPITALEERPAKSAYSIGYWRRQESSATRYIYSLDKKKEIIFGCVESRSSASEEGSGSTAQDYRVSKVQFVHQQPRYDWMRSSIQTCSAAHASCQPTCSPDLINVRVLDVFSRTIIPLPPNKNFIALSVSAKVSDSTQYVWGGVEQPRVKQTGLAPKKLPKTIEDAIIVVQKLGYRYLWTDSICIDQHNLKEKDKHIRLMDRIYSGATATIIVLNSSSAKSGIQGVSTSREATQEWAEFSDQKMMSRLPSVNKDLNTSIWKTRAWTFQESLLSHRRIVFTKNQAHFVCNESAHSEDAIYSLSLAKDLNVHPTSEYLTFINPSISHVGRWDDTLRMRIFSTMVGEYVTRKMTNEGDALNAVSALLQELETTTMADGFLLGLPLLAFRYALLWCPPYFENQKRFPKRRVAGNFPSWSWLGWVFVIRVWTRAWHVNLRDLQPPMDVSYLGSAIDPDKYLKYINPEMKRSPVLEKTANRLQALFKKHVQRASKSENDSLEKYHTEDHLLRISGLVLSLPFQYDPAHPKRLQLVGPTTEYEGRSTFTLEKDILKDGWIGQKCLDFLWLTTGYLEPNATYPTDVALEGLTIEWKNGIAYRTGHGSLRMEEKSFHRLLETKWELEYKTIWLG